MLMFWNVALILPSVSDNVDNVLPAPKPVILETSNAPILLSIVVTVAFSVNTFVSTPAPPAAIAVEEIALPLSLTALLPLPKIMLLAVKLEPVT